MKAKIWILALVLVLLLAVAGVVLANGSIELARAVLGGGASDSNAGNITMQATLGQPVVGVISGGNITLGQGFWHGAAPGYIIYLPMNIRN